MEDSGFFGPVYSRSVETSEEDEVERVLKAALVAVGSGAVFVDRVNAKRLVLFVEVLKYS